MHHLRNASGTTISYDRYGSGPPLVLVHGSFSDHRSNWQFVAEALEQHFTVHAVARRGRGESEATQGHDVPDEAGDVAALIASIDEPVFLLGHSYGAQVALAAAASLPDRVRKLILYEPPWPHILAEDQRTRLEALAAAAHWDDFVSTFFRDTLAVPAEEIAALQQTEFWADIVADAEASLQDMRALLRYRFDPARFGALQIPVLLQIGSESPRDLFATDALAAAMPDVRIDSLSGQAHEGMNTAPAQYVESVRRFLS